MKILKLCVGKYVNSSGSVNWYKLVGKEFLIVKAMISILPYPAIYTLWDLS